MNNRITRNYLVDPVIEDVRIKNMVSGLDTTCILVYNK